jgi:hypothetical protein
VIDLSSDELETLPIIPKQDTKTCNYYNKEWMAFQFQYAKQYIQTSKPVDPPHNPTDRATHKLLPAPGQANPTQPSLGNKACLHRQICCPKKKAPHVSLRK